MKRLFYSLLPVLFSALVVIANESVKPACSMIFHQPAVPEALRK